MSINNYFFNHPDMVLGTLTRKDTLYGGEGYSVTGNGDLTGQLKDAVSRLPRFAPSNVVPIAEIARLHTPAANSISARAAFSWTTTASFAKSLDGQSVPVTYGGTTLNAGGTLTGKRMAALIDFAIWPAACCNPKTKVGRK